MRHEVDASSICIVGNVCYSLVLLVLLVLLVRLEGSSGSIITSAFSSAQACRSQRAAGAYETVAKRTERIKW